MSGGKVSALRRYEHIGSQTGKPKRGGGKKEDEVHEAIWDEEDMIVSSSYHFQAESMWTRSVLGRRQEADRRPQEEICRHSKIKGPHLQSFRSSQANQLLSLVGSLSYSNHRLSTNSCCSAFRSGHGNESKSISFTSAQMKRGMPWICEKIAQKFKVAPKSFASNSSPLPQRIHSLFHPDSTNWTGHWSTRPPS